MAAHVKMKKRLVIFSVLTMMMLGCVLLYEFRRRHADALQICLTPFINSDMGSFSIRLLENFHGSPGDNAYEAHFENGCYIHVVKRIDNSCEVIGVTAECSAVDQ